MKKCNFCNVTIKDETGHCPLCGSVLEGADPGISSYPNVMEKEKVISFIFRLMLFISIVTIVICVGINITTHVPTKWSLIVASCLAYGLFIIYMFLREGAGYRLRIFSFCILGVLLVIMIDYILGFNGWSVNYAVPSVIVALDIGFVVLMIVNHRNWQSYILIMFFMLILSIIPIVLHRIGIITNPYPSQISFGLSLFLTIGVVIFGGPRVKRELHRRFHIMGK